MKPASRQRFRRPLWAVALVGALTALDPLGCGGGKTPPLAARNALADSADQVLYHAKSILTDRGVMKAELHADTGYFFDDNTRIEMRVLETTFFTLTGARNAVLTSREGTYNTRSGNMQARGNVVVVSQDGRRLTTPELRYFQGRNEITSDSAFVLTDSTHRQMTGIGFNSDPNMNDVRCLRSCAGTAGVVSLTGAGRDSAPATAGGRSNPSSPARGGATQRGAPPSSGRASIVTGSTTKADPPPAPQRGALRPRDSVQAPRATPPASPSASPSGSSAAPATPPAANATTPPGRSGS